MTREPERTPALLTIGHSAHEWPVFAGLLRRHGIDTIVDVRSSPYSRHAPQFNREPLERAAREAGIRYLFLGRELGARRAEQECYAGRRADYRLIAAAPLFREGLERVRGLVRTARPALLCAEKDPITCHRMVLVCHALRGDAAEIAHVREDGSLESNAEAEARLLDETGQGGGSLFGSRDDLLEEAYRIQGERIAWREPERLDGSEPSAPGDAGSPGMPRDPLASAGRRDLTP